MGRAVSTSAFVGSVVRYSKYNLGLSLRTRAHSPCTPQAARSTSGRTPGVSQSNARCDPKHTKNAPGGPGGRSIRSRSKAMATEHWGQFPAQRGSPSTSRSELGAVSQGRPEPSTRRIGPAGLTGSHIHAQQGTVTEREASGSSEFESHSETMSTGARVLGPPAK